MATILPQVFEEDAIYLILMRKAGSESLTDLSYAVAHGLSPTHIDLLVKGITGRWRFTHIRSEPELRQRAQLLVILKIVNPMQGNAQRLESLLQAVQHQVTTMGPNTRLWDALDRPGIHLGLLVLRILFGSSQYDMAKYELQSLCVQASSHFHIGSPSYWVRRSAFCVNAVAQELGGEVESDDDAEELFPFANGEDE